MKTDRIKISILVLATTITSCTDDLEVPGNGPAYSISGRLYEDCSMLPAGNQTIDLFQSYLTGLDGHPTGGVLAETTTDANGYFRFDFKDMKGSTEKIRMPAGFGYTDIMDGIPQNKSHENLVVLKNPSTFIRVNILVQNPYTVNDTLFITDFRNLNQKLKIPGPFATGNIYITGSFPMFFTPFGPYSSNIGYSINNINWAVKPFQLTLCDTSEVTIEIL